MSEEDNDKKVKPIEGNNEDLTPDELVKQELEQQESRKKHKEDKKMLKGMVNRMNQAEQRINTNQANTIINAQKDKAKIQKYDQEISNLGIEYDKFREKDPAVFNTKVKSEVEFALLRISEKRYKAELEAENLKQVLSKKNAYIHELEIKMKEMKRENEELKSRVVELEDENNELADGKPRRQKKQQQNLNDGTMRNGMGFEETIETRDDLSEMGGGPHGAVSVYNKSIAKQRGGQQNQQPQFDEEDAFWYQNELPPQRNPNNNNAPSDAGFDAYTNTNSNPNRNNGGGADLWMGSGNNQGINNSQQNQHNGSMGSVKQTQQQNNQIGLKNPKMQVPSKIPQNQDRVNDDMAFYGVGVKSGKATFAQKGGVAKQ
eukprot:403359523